MDRLYPSNYEAKGWNLTLREPTEASAPATPNQGSEQRLHLTSFPLHKERAIERCSIPGAGAGAASYTRMAGAVHRG